MSGPARGGQGPAGGRIPGDNAGNVTDFRDQHIKRALDEVVSPYRPEATPRARMRRIAAIAAIALLVFAGFWAALYFSSPKHAARPATGKAIPIQLLPPPAKP